MANNQDQQNSATLVTFLNGTNLTSARKKWEIEKMAKNGNQIGNLTTIENRRLEYLENVVVKNCQGFYIVGRALAEIKENKLYRMQHLTFAGYCRRRFLISRRRSYQYIDASSVIDRVKHGAQIKMLPLNEKQVRPLTRLEPNIQKKAWEKVVKSASSDGRITGRFVGEVVDGLLGAEMNKKTEKIIKAAEPVALRLIDVVRAEIQKLDEQIKTAQAKKKRRMMFLKEMEGK